MSDETEKKELTLTDLRRGVVELGISYMRLANVVLALTSKDALDDVEERKKLREWIDDGFQRVNSMLESVINTKISE